MQTGNIKDRIGSGTPVRNRVHTDRVRHRLPLDSLPSTRTPTIPVIADYVIALCRRHLLGFVGPKAQAEHIKARLTTFLRDDLALNLSPERP